MSYRISLPIGLLWIDMSENDYNVEATERAFTDALARAMYTAGYEVDITWSTSLSIRIDREDGVDVGDDYHHIMKIIDSVDTEYIDNLQPAAPEIEAAPAASAFKRKSLTNIILSVMDHKQAESADDTIARLQAENAALKDALEDEVARTSEQSEKADFWKLLSDKHADRADENYRVMLDCQKQLADADAVNKATIAALENAQRVNGAQADEMIAARYNEERYRKALSEVHAIAVKNKGGFNANPMNHIFNAAHQALSGTDADDDE